jgi:hypothetical protein
VSNIFGGKVVKDVQPSQALRKLVPLLTFNKGNEVRDVQSRQASVKLVPLLTFNNGNDVRDAMH